MRYSAQLAPFRMKSRRRGVTIQTFRSIPVGSLKLLVFDLDGTLADTTRDLANSVNATLGQFGRQQLPEKLIAGFVGNGVPMLLRRCMARISRVSIDAVRDEVLTPMYQFFLDYYAKHDLDYTYAYPGVRETLEELREGLGGAPRTLAVLTNKPVRPAVEILEGLGIASYFRRIVGGDSLLVKKPDPQGLLLLMNETRVLPEETVMIGDSKTDVETARNAGAWVLGCAFGFGPQNLMDDPPDVLVTSAWAWTVVLTKSGGQPELACVAPATANCRTRRSD